MIPMIPTTPVRSTIPSGGFGDANLPEDPTGGIVIPTEPEDPSGGFGDAGMWAANLFNRN